MDKWIWEKYKFFLYLGATAIFADMAPPDIAVMQKYQNGHFVSMAPFDNKIRMRLT